MKKLFVAILLVALCGGCDNNAVCVIEYMDGEIEEVEARQERQGEVTDWTLMLANAAMNRRAQDRRA